MGAFRLFLVVGCLLCSEVGRSSATWKRFVSSWDFSNTRNWVGGRTPCPGRDVTFRTKPTFPIHVRDEIGVKSIEFLFDAEIIFGENLDLRFDGERDESCSGDDQSNSVFENKAVGHWWDPDSWSCEKEGLIDCNEAVPHIYRVPCLTDTVKLPKVEESVYNIIFSDPRPTVKQLLLGTKNLSTSEFYEFSTSAEGRERVTLRYSDGERAPLFVESEGNCFDITGCPCHPQTPSQQICRRMEGKCPEVTCSNPIRMSGFCCDLCGLEVTITHNGSLALSAIRNLLQRVLNFQKSKGVLGYADKMPDNKLHVYFVPKYETVDYRGAVKSFLELFSKEHNSYGKHVFSTLGATGTVAEKMMREKEGQASRTVIILVVVFIILTASFLTIYLYRKRRMSDLPFMFRRMSMRSMSMRSTRRTSIPSFGHVASFSVSDQRSFVNPTFGHSSTIQSFPSSSTLHTTLDDIQEDVRPPQENISFAPKILKQQDQGILLKSLEEDKDRTKCEASESSETKPHPEESTHENPLQSNPENPATEAFESNRAQEESETLIEIDLDNEARESTGKEEEMSVDEDDEEDPLETLAKTRLGKGSLNASPPADDAEANAKEEEEMFKGDLFELTME